MHISWDILYNIHDKWWCATHFVSKLSLLSKQRVKMSNECSDWGAITKGIPQGSILGPLIFNIFLNDIFYFAKECYIFNYADDNYISVNHKELKLVRDALEEESKIMVEWFNSNSLQANPCKFQGILFKGAKQVNDLIRNWCTRCLYWWWYEFQQSCKQCM